MLKHCFTAILAASASTCPSLAQGHPHFEDGGALQWQTKLAAAKQAARKADKVILVEYGREA